MKSAISVALACLLVTVLPAKATAARSSGVVESLAGQYRHSFRNADVQGHEYWSDDIVEIVPVNPAAAYIRAELNFFNGHICSINGVGRANGDRIVYVGQVDGSPATPPCVLSVSRQGSDLRLDDGDGSCKPFCGARGTLSGITLPFASRRPSRTCPG